MSRKRLAVLLSISRLAAIALIVFLARYVRPDERYFRLLPVDYIPRIASDGSEAVVSEGGILAAITVFRVFNTASYYLADRFVLPGGLLLVAVPLLVGLFWKPVYFSARHALVIVPAIALLQYVVAYRFFQVPPVFALGCFAANYLAYLLGTPPQFLPRRFVYAVSFGGVFLAELVFPAYLIHLWRNAGVPGGGAAVRGRLATRLAPLIVFGFTVNLAVLTAAYACFIFCAPERATAVAERLADGEFYKLHFDSPTGRLYACNVGTDHLLVLDAAAPASDAADRVLIDRAIDTNELEDIAFNTARREIYHFNSVNQNLLVYDADTLDLKTRVAYKSDQEEGGSARVAFDNRSHTIAMRQEHSSFWIVDMNDFHLIAHRPRVGVDEDALIFDEATGNYVLSYYRNHPYFRLISPDGERLRDVPAPRDQLAALAIPRRGEIYLTVPMWARIYVYDAATLAPTRILPAVFGVRELAYDEPHNLLLAVSICTGYVEVFDLRDNRSIERIFVDYYLRDIEVNPAAREAYVSSRNGVYRFGY